MRGRELLVALAALGLAGCIAWPRQEADDASCRLLTHSYTLGAVPAGNAQFSCSGDARGCLVMVSIIPAASLVVSGSIVAVGNTVHWVERQGRCSDSAARRAAAGVADSGRKAGGEVLSTAQDALHWLRQSAPGPSP